MGRQDTDLADEPLVDEGRCPVSSPEKSLTSDERRARWARGCKSGFWTGLVAFMFGAVSSQGAGMRGNIFATALVDGGMLLVVLSIVGFLVLAVVRVVNRDRR